MNMHMPQDAESSAELRYLAAVPRQIISPANNSSIVGIFQDSLLGLYRFTREGINFNPRQAMNLLAKNKKVDPSIFLKKGNVKNFDIFSQILPPLSTYFKNGQFGDDESSKTSNNVVEIINGVMKRGQLDKKVKSLIHSIFNDFGFQSSQEFIDNLQNIVTEYMKTSAYSVGISDLIADKQTNEKIASAITNNKQKVKDLIDQSLVGTFENNTGKSNEEEFETQINGILNQAREDAGKIGRKSLSKDNRFVIMVNAGSKGSNINIAQMISCLGQQNVDGKRIPYGFEDRTLPHYKKYDDSPEARGFVENSFIQGLTPQELFFHAMGGRVGLIDTAVKTSQTGYIQRRLIKGLEDLKVEYDMTVRNNKKKIVQFTYGDDGIDTTKVENQFIPLVNMTTEEIYAHYRMPSDSLKDEVYTTNYTTAALKRMAKQSEELKTKAMEYIESAIQSRNDIVDNVFNYTDKSNIHIPVHFSRIINNIKNQLKITSNSLVNITPLECFQMIESCKNDLNMLQLCAPSKLFFVVFDHFMSPKELLMKHRFTRKGMQLLITAIITNYKKSLVSPGEMVGMIAAQSIGEPTTQMTLNTFHHAGISSKSNVTRGVPRIEEILSLSKEPKNPSVTVYLKDHDKFDKMKAQQMKYLIEHTSLREIVSSVSICFDPDNLNTLVHEDKNLISQYKEFQSMVEECAGIDSKSEDDAKSKWILRFELDKEEMLEQNITMDDVYFALKTGYKDEVECIFSDFNNDKLVMRIRLMDMLTSKKKDALTQSEQNYLDQSDEIYMLKNIQENLLDNIILKGIKKIKKVNLRSVKDSVFEEKGNFIRKDSWVLDTVGSNLMDILALDNIDKYNTFSNDIVEIYKTLGIEAARQIIYDEIIEVIAFDGTYINSHHIEMLCDRMCNSHKMISIFRHGINNDDIGPIAKASFEETPEMFLRAARHGELDHMNGISASVMTGQLGKYGTSSFGVVLDIQKIASLGSKTMEEKMNVDKMFDIEDETDVCATTNIKMNNDANLIDSKIVDEDDDYNPGF